MAIGEWVPRITTVYWTIYNWLDLPRMKPKSPYEIFYSRIRRHKTDHSVPNQWWWISQTLFVNVTLKTTLAYYGRRMCSFNTVLHRISSSSLHWADGHNQLLSEQPRFSLCPSSCRRQQWLVNQALPRLHPQRCHRAVHANAGSYHTTRYQRSKCSYHGERVHSHDVLYEPYPHIILQQCIRLVLLCSFYLFLSLHSSNIRSLLSHVHRIIS